MDALVRQLNALSDDQPWETMWHLKNLRTGEVADRQGDVVVPSASTRKIAIMMAALEAVNEGRLSLDQTVTVQAKYQDNNSGVCQHMTPGATFTFRDALVLMIIVSDNVCTATVAELVGLDAVNALCRSIGMRGTTHRHGLPPKGLGRDHPVEASNATTANDVGVLLDLILQGSRDPAAAARLGCTPELCRLALDILSWQKLRNRLPLLLPPGTKVAHKTGTGARNNNDAGIIYQGEEPLFVLTVYTDNLPLQMPDGSPSFTAASFQIARMAKLCYDTLAT